MNMNLDLFDEADPQPARSESIGPRSVVLRGYALPSPTPCCNPWTK